MTFKKFLMFFSLALTLLACVPAQAAPTEKPATEIPATEAPAATEEPLPEVSKITFFYEYNFVPENWVKNYTDREVITFYSSGKEWSVKTLSPTYLYKGPLFPIELDTIHNKSGDCGINSYFLNEESGDQQMAVRPACREPNSEETATMTVRLPNCSRDISKKLTCKYDGSFGSLQYSLNKDQDIFKFQYSGNWDLMFEDAMNTSLVLLGFTPPTEEFYKNTIPDKIYTIYKNPGGE